MPKVFRPSYSATNSAINELANALGLKVIIWSISPADCGDPPPEEIARRVLAKIKGGSIVVLHDGHIGAKAHVNTVAALPIILKGLEQKGLVAVTVSELLKLP